jgi:hypothetical protein
MYIAQNLIHAAYHLSIVDDKIIAQNINFAFLAIKYLFNNELIDISTSSLIEILNRHPLVQMGEYTKAFLKAQIKYQRGNQELTLAWNRFLITQQGLFEFVNCDTKLAPFMN